MKSFVFVVILACTLATISALVPTAFVAGPPALRSPRTRIASVAMSAAPRPIQPLPHSSVRHAMLALVVGLVLSGAGEPALAEGRTGVQVFEAKCAACHKGGGNQLNSQKTLSKEDLEKNGYVTKEDIIKIVSEGKRAMPAYAIKSKFLGLSPDEIDGVSAYVFENAQKGWGK